ncbi:hypothetical protein HN51_000118 [Arachis hypogaea]|uniref:RRM domain-containing protein n=2 Tax=Arachis TaxID=3817 RepID=A0A445EX60_ARAHY|nr:uncharacterized protein LOC107479005 [Arachis duranensis]XP_025687473.1 nucleolin [Arachis hypogaea]QHO47920.1 uncharacterized protein DS421_1g01310 [Arachis hypogaea]RYR79990.1 hypothetical protein Ahy_A01g004779 [Arachis hypogaea]
MRTRNADSSSKSTTPKKAPPARKAAAKSAGESPAAKRNSTVKTRQIKKKEASSASNSIPDPNPDEPNSDEVVTTTPYSKRKPGRPRTKAVATPKLEEELKAVADETLVVDNSGDVEEAEKPQNVEVVDADNIDHEKEEHQEQVVECVGQSEEKEQKSMEVDETVKGNNAVEAEATASQDATMSSKQPERTLVDLNISVNEDDSMCQKEGEKEDEELNERDGREELKDQEQEKGDVELKEQEGEKGGEELKEQEAVNVKEELKEEDGDKGKEEVKDEEGETAKEETKEEETNITGHKGCSNTDSAVMKDQSKEDFNTRIVGDEVTESSERLDFEEHGGEDIEEDPEEGPWEPPEENEALQEEHRELEAIANQRKSNKEHEIFVGGLDRDATEEDLRKVFKRIGEVVDVRLHKNSSTNKNKGYAFVRFANKEHAKRALSEMKNPVIRGKRCGTAPSEDNNTLFLGNICNTWTKEAIKQKLKDYGIDGVENITLVLDAKCEGLSRGFAFLEFSSHGDAMLAYKRLQKPDAIFGHPERSAKVAFAEPMREPDPEIMAQVKSVFINGLPPHWEEDHIREMLKSYGEIVRIVLARNISTAKRKDYGFVDFSTHEAAVACVEAVNKSELGDGASKIKVRARLSNPVPKTQAVKGGICGGFRIGHGRSGAFARSGRGYGRGRQPFNSWGNINRGRGVYHGGPRQIGRMDFRDDLDFNMYPDYHHRQFGPEGAMRGGHYPSNRGAAFAGPGPPRPYHDRAWGNIPAEGPSEPFPLRRPYSPGGQFNRPFSPGGQFNRPFMGRHFDDPYFYDDNVHGMKRPFYMTDPEPDYMGANRLRPRLDYADPSLFHENRHNDSYGAGSRQYPPDYYGSDYGRGPYSSFYGGDSSHGHGYYY